MTFPHKIFIALMASLWLLPALANASLPPVAEVVTAQTAEPAVPTLGVVSAVPSPDISINPVAILPACFAAADQAILLAQPATCWRLTMAHPTALPQVTAREAQSTTSVKVATNLLQWLPSHLLPPLPDPALPYLSLVSFILVVLLAVVALGRILFGAKPAAARLRQTMPLNQLMVLRC